MPFPRDPDFVGRNETLDQLHQKASTAGARLALVGLGGVGSETQSNAVLGQPLDANYIVGKRNWPLNTATRSDSNQPTRGSSGYMLVTPLDVRRVSETSPIELRFPGARTVTAISFKLSGTGYKTKKSANGFSFWTMLTMTSFFANY